jgi:alpha-1,2-mannosyltransferase
VIGGGGAGTAVPKQLPLLRRLPLWAPPVVLSAVSLVLLLTVAGDHRGYDLDIYRGALRAWLDGVPLYDYAHPGDSRQLGFTYPPFAALLLVPLAVLPGVAAQLLHAATGAAALVMITYVLGEPVARRRGLSPWYAVALALPVLVLLEPVRDSFGFGQVNLHLAALVVGDLVLLRRGSRWAGAGTGLAAAVKLTPAFLLVHLVVCGRYRAAAVGTTVAAGATALAALVAPSTSRDFWFGALLDTGRVGAADSPSNQALSGLLARAAETQAPPRVLWVVCAVVVAAIGLWRARAADRAGDVTAGFALAGVTGALVSPISWIHHLWWVVPVLAVLLVRCSRRASAAAVALVVVFSASLPDLARVPLEQHRSSVPGFLGESALCLALLAVLALLPVQRGADELT